MKLFSAKQNGNDALVSDPRLVFGGFSNLTQPFKKPEKKDLDIRAMVDRLKSQSRFPVKQLEDAANMLSGLSRFMLKTEKRLEIASAIFKVMYPIASDFYYKYQTQFNSLPESNERRTALVACIRAITRMSTIYRQAFTECYSEENRKFHKHANEIYEYAFRILELLMIEQRLRALRYQKLSVESWLDCNQVFFSMAKHGHIDVKLHLFGPMGMRGRNKNQKGGHPYDSSVRRLYQSIQLFGVLDVSTWPTHLFHLPDALQDTLRDSLRFIPDHGEELKPGQMLIAHRQACPPLFVRPENAVYISILLDYETFYNTLVKEYESIASMKFINKFDEKKLLHPMVKLAENDRVPVLELMLNRLRKRERKSRRHTIFDNNTVRVYFGMVEVMRLLGDMVGKDFKQVLRNKRLTDQLALKSSIVFTGESKPISAKWEMVNFSAGGILISTLESDFSTPVQLGQLVAFLPADEQKHVSLGYVCRMNRPEDNLVEVGISRLANYSEIVVIKGVGGDEDKLFMTAVLAMNSGNNWYLVSMQNDLLQPGIPVTIERYKQKIPARIGNVYLTKKEFQVFEIRSPGLSRNTGK